ncbi:MAG: TonB C-terminal domain-containing protein [Candidatus Aminicenantes bacterium]|nr:TonB C-terminal domain-containing protein [Candidatus Aminicenantes bacterium]
MPWRTTIDDDKKTTLTKGAVLAVSLALHGVVFYLALTWKIDVRIIDFKHERTDVLLVPPPKIKFTAGAGGGAVAPSGQAGIPAAAQGGQSSAGEEPRAGAGGEGISVGRVPLVIGGMPGDLLTTDERERNRELLSGFSLVYPADAMLNLSKYAQVPEDDWLRPFKRSLKPAPDLSSPVRPPAGKPSVSLSLGTGGGGSGGGGIGTIKPPPAGVVAAFVPDDVKTFDLSGWASAILNAVQRHWSMGTSPGQAEWSGRVTFTILVMASGELNAVDLSASSGLEPLDAAAHQAIERSGPWPALPEGFPGTSLEIQLVFKYGK